MRAPFWLGLVVPGLLAAGCRHQAGELVVGNDLATNPRIFAAKGIIRELKPGDRSVVIEHEAIPNYMAAMTMRFRVRQPEGLAGLKPGDEISFRLLVSPNESWIDRLKKTRRGMAATPSQTPRKLLSEDSAHALDNGPRSPHPLLDYQFTNELGEAVSLSQFRGQALAITFFFTRCPLPEFCPRLSKNFEEAAQKLKALPGTPTNWHFLSVSFDTDFDTPRVLKAYGELYHYDPQHWSFLTGPADKISELARGSDVKIEREGGLFNHDFRTLIIDATGRLQMSFPVGGNLSEDIVREILKAAAVTNR